MKANELRLGNWLNHEDYGAIKVVSITRDEVNFKYYIGNENNDGEVHPIPLTEEWLVKFGFESYCNKQQIEFFELDYFKLENDGGDFLYDDELHIEYVHQLQNLHFALTGTELELK